MAQWLDTVFSAMDLGVFTLMHNMAVAAGESAGPEITSFLTYLMHFISFFAHDGLCMFALGVILMIPRRTRKLGVCVFLAVCCGGIITNLTLKPLVARMRPYANMEHLAATVKDWWIAVGQPLESDRSFPSGHTTSATAAMVGLFLASRRKKYIWPVLIFPFMMATSRVYLMVHYTSDVLAGLISGFLGGLAAFFITRWLFGFLERHRNVRLFAFALDFEPIAFLKGLKRSKAKDEN
ncbi:MAG: phosphatase PAP2 family protein [Ruminococcaceae bacterium]|nr:phosphatase PAP2 family protein [Oscillospiraceae bacterium]